MTARLIPEWIGKTPGSTIPPRVKLRIVESQDGYCAGPCHRTFDAKLKPEFDHRPALINGGENRESMIVAVCRECHSMRTKLDVMAKSLTARIRKKSLGLRPATKFRGWRKFNGDIVWRQEHGKEN